MLKGTDYVQFDILITIPKLHFVLRNEDNKQVVEL